MKIEYTDELSLDAAQRMHDGFIEYERENGIEINYKKFSFVLLDENNIACGVLCAYTAFAEIYVEDLWVDKLYRGKGYGTRLIHALENHFKDKGYNNINLVTSAFQAADFYKKCGYEVEFVRENKTNPKLTKTFFVKYLAI